MDFSGRIAQVSSMPHDMERAEAECKCVQEFYELVKDPIYVKSLILREFAVSTPKCNLLAFRTSIDSAVPLIRREVATLAPRTIGDNFILDIIRNLPDLLFIEYDCRRCSRKETILDKLFKCCGHRCESFFLLLDEKIQSDEAIETRSKSRFHEWIEKRLFDQKN